ncbi:MAG: hypothetical protein ACPGJR_00290 [Akkermansiaceae bacterium]
MTDLHQHKRLDAHLREVWRRGQKLHRTAGVLTFCHWALLLFLAGMAVDWLFDLPAGVRVAILVVLAVVALCKAWRSGWRHLRRYDATHTALRVEKEHGGLESLLVTAVQFGDPRSTAGGSEALREKTRHMAEKAADPLRPETTVSFKGLRRFALLALIPVMVIAGLAIINGPVLAAGFGRIFTPWLAVEYPTRTQIEINDGDRIVKEGEGLRLVAEISGEVPESAEIILRTGKGKPRERKLPIVDGLCEYGAETVFRSFDYRIAAGDAESDWHAVQVVSAPRIEQVEVTLDYPDYTRRPVEAVEALTLTVPEGTKIRWEMTLDRAVKEAEFRPAERTARPLEIGADGRSVKMEQVGSESRAYSFGWVDKEHGFAFSSPRHYLQVAPDRAPGVDLTSPDRNLFATLERGLDFAFRGRDDHGIGEAAIIYRVNKTEEEKVVLPAPEDGGSGEQKIDWDYRKALPDLIVGDTVSFAVEVADRYPGPDGPHRVRSDARRVQFLSKEDYLAQIEKQKRRLLTQIRTIYREERGVHDLIRNLDPTADVFVQTCQLEAVRQDLIRERLGVIRSRIDFLVDDLAANKVSEEAESAVLAKLGTELQRIGDDHVGQAASLLRKLAAVENGKGEGRKPESAIDMVNSSARELGLLVLQLGFAEASDVMARELHATAQTQAALRMQTIFGGAGDGEKAGLEKAQIRLAEETARLLAATPRNKESTSVDALIAFNLSRLVNGLLRSGADAKMREAASLVSRGEAQSAARIQAEVIEALLKAEFRLRRGAEYEALTIARDLFTTQAAGQKKLREEGTALTAEEFGKKKSGFVRTQSALRRQIQLLLMPEIPAPRARLFDAAAPGAPPVDDLLAAAESGIGEALARIEAGDREAAAGHQQRVENAFAELAEITRKRMEDMTQQAQMKASVAAFGKHAAQLFMLEERLLVLLEQVEDAADDEVNTAFLSTLNQALAEDAEGFRNTIALWDQTQGPPGDENLPLLDSLGRIARAVGAATPLLKENNPDDAIELHEQALDAIEEANALIEELTATRSSFAGVLATTEGALAPSPLLAEIEDEQTLLTGITEKAKPEDYPALVIPQKNLIHAVDAVLTSLDPLAHKIESGTVMLFAKDDMDSAAIGLEEDDVEETLDAQSFVVETLQDLRAKIDHVTPEYRYILEVTEFMYEVVPQSAVIRTGVRQVQEEAGGAPDAEDLKGKVERFGRDLRKLTGEQRYADTTAGLADVIGTVAGSETEVDDALDALVDDTAEMQLLMENLAYLITPPPLGSIVEEPSDEVKMIHAALAVAAHHKDLSRVTQSSAKEQLPGLAPRQQKLADQCKELFPPPPPPPPPAPAPVPSVEPAEEPPAEDPAEAPEEVDPFEAGEPEIDAEPEPELEIEEPVQPPMQPAPEPHPQIAAAHQQLTEAAAKLASGDRDAAIASQDKAAAALRYFILEYALKYVAVPPPPPPEDPAPSDDAEPDDSELQLFMPGALTGERPKGGRLEWQVLGRRDRAALNENFARELPLEYRAILKDYYERLTE